MDVPQCGNLAIFQPLISREINFDLFQKVKTAVLTILEALNFDFFGKISHWNVSTIPKNSKFRAAQLVKMAVFGA